MNKLKLYGIFYAPTGIELKKGKLVEKDDVVLVSVIAQKKQLKEYINRLFFNAHQEHFYNWCDLQGFEFMKDTEESDTFFPPQEVWDKYFMSTQLYEEANKYILLRLTYTKDMLASIMRSFMKSVPLGCSFEHPTEPVLFMEEFKERHLDDYNDVFDDTDDTTTWDA